MLLRSALTPLRIRLSCYSSSTVSTAVSATCLRDIARSGARVVKLQLSKSSDLVCRQLMCEHVGDACACRLALTLERVPRLQRLDLSNNQLRDLPDAVYALQSLETLDLQQNRLTSLPTDVHKLTQLETLDIRHNKLETLPVQQLETLTKLQTLRVAGNTELIQSLKDGQLSMSDELKKKIELD
ncbi:uncharacterized protein PITG_08406 [Phytophthora infestans T30-4]|uniref:Disease resistance R13L4/SHOC-2-like LRR domain-containing protein n=1 Tax=Phytophthora infestans (strain T30-4) TaxID=403677 RepID=D0NAI7_PHYIT|nr:uncharacterized protein PITG_08406 [Phytophthora infestans T30-4]EEY54845.1 conserved hypothetical protein [Phytophthora infestans T30-4]|eukprot:XP_002903790.1 conserved hypothetical protein [Phytophthora infestans T30-4]